MKKHLILLLLTFLSIHNNYAQKETTNWYFGNKAGLKINNTSVSSLIGGQIQYNEGVSSISDCKGNLLFYTDGINVWNRNHVVMVNGSGLLGHYSTTQGSIIIKHPENCDLFYIFTLDGYESGFVNGFRYSIVDLSLQNGLGEITVKNVLLYGPSSEKLTAVKHSNGVDIWVITHKIYTNEFYAYWISVNGINPNPVISSVGSAFNDNNDALGQMKASPDGSRLAYVTLVSKITEIFDFDNTTGIVSNPITVPANKFNVDGGLYGLEFSPDAGKLYVSNPNIDYPLQSGNLYQIDLLAGSATNIINSTMVVGTNAPPTDIRGMQLGADKKIYVARSLGAHLGVINTPEASGTACNYVDLGVSIAGKICGWTLPNFMTSFFENNNFSQLKANFNFFQTCYGKTTSFLNTSQGNANDFFWNFGDGTNAISQNPSHFYLNKGNYKVFFVIKNECCSDTISGNVLIDDCESNLNIPNIITPNGDGINDKFDIGRLIKAGVNIEKQVIIYNRWGKKVYESINYKNDFDGGNLPEAVYYVTIKVKGNLIDEDYKTSLQILRK